MPRIDSVMYHREPTRAGHNTYWPYDPTRWVDVPRTEQQAIDETAEVLAALDMIVPVVDLDDVITF